MMAVVVFGWIFIQANPDLAKWVGESLEWVQLRITEYLSDVDFAEIILIAIVAWWVLGQLLPIFDSFAAAEFSPLLLGQPNGSDESQSKMFAPYRNTLLAVIILFVAYLIFEFQTLWFRDFPEGFYYAGYAHEGAAWLTFALAVATLMLSLIFRGATLKDERIQSLKTLAWIWSALNLALAIAVYNRMWIYVDFNGMTRMRVLGLFGISTVVAGFVLVVLKIRREKSFLWLIQRQLWTLAIAIYLLSVTPVDYLVHSYNVAQILDGKLAPSVQITEHPVDESGWLVLHALIDCGDEIIRDGIRAKLASFQYSERQRRWGEWDANSKHWTAYQIVHRALKQKMKESNSELSAFPDQESREAAWTRFKDYAYQWY